MSDYLPLISDCWMPQVSLSVVMRERARRQRPLLFHHLLSGLFLCCEQSSIVPQRRDGGRCRRLPFLAEMRRGDEHHHRLALHLGRPLRRPVFHAQSGAGRATDLATDKGGIMFISLPHFIDLK